MQSRSHPTPVAIAEPAPLVKMFWTPVTENTRQIAVKMARAKRCCERVPPQAERLAVSEAPGVRAQA
jgi:hypothetical protein